MDGFFGKSKGTREKELDLACIWQDQVGLVEIGAGQEMKLEGETSEEEEGDDGASSSFILAKAIGGENTRIEDLEQGILNVEVGSEEVDGVNIWAFCICDLIMQLRMIMQILVVLI